MTLKYKISVDLDFDFLSQDYKDLYESAQVTPFQSPLWLHHLHQRLVPNLEARRYTIVIRDKDAQSLLAIFPFVIQKAVLGQKMMQFADFGCSDYNAVIGQETILNVLANDKAVLEEVDWLTKQADLLLIRKVREDSFDISRFFKKMIKTPNDNAAYHFVPKEDVSAEGVLAGDSPTTSSALTSNTPTKESENWEQQIFSKSFLKRVRRYERKFSKDHGGYAFKKLTSPEDVEIALMTMKLFHENRFEESLLQQDTYLQFYIRYIIEAIVAEEGALFALYAGDKIIASEFVLLKEDRFTSILTAANLDQYAQYSLGHQILYKLCQSLVSDGRSHIDLGIGGYSYKKSFDVAETKLYNYSQALSLSGNAIAMTYNYVKPLKNILKRYVPHVR